MTHSPKKKETGFRYFDKKLKMEMLEAHHSGASIFDISQFVSDELGMPAIRDYGISTKAELKEYVENLIEALIGSDIDNKKC